MMHLLLSFVFNNHRILIGVALLIAVISITLFLYNKGYYKCKQEQIVKTITVVEKRNEIANHRPDTKQFLDGLLNDKEW